MEVPRQKFERLHCGLYTEVLDFALYFQEELAQQTLKAMTRKFKESAKVWLRAYSHDRNNADAAAAGRTLDRAIKALPQRKHIKVCTTACFSQPPLL